jgi:hypothetical protein
MPACDVSAAIPTSKHSRTFHSKPPNVEVLDAADVPTPIWKTGLASDGMSKEKAVRRVFNVNEE